ncbi:MAG: FMN-binding negative transcriptional regulator [Alphaproteobacteria bacterium]|nr:FMN-binding negative transcriptional regulator [Alphaproteobacteria bacterium]
MYIPAPFAETDNSVLHDLIDAYGFGILISLDECGAPVASHIPFELDRASGDNGTLQAHLARANPQWRGFNAGNEILCIFEGPHAYISPRWYDPANNAVPTWNYVVVHAYGVPKIVEDTEKVRAQQEALVARHEEAVIEPWRLDNQPQNYIESMLKGIVAFEIPIARIEGKFKLNQNHPAANRAGAISGLRKEAGDPLSLAVADLMAAALASGS